LPLIITALLLTGCTQTNSPSYPAQTATATANQVESGQKGMRVKIAGWALARGLANPSITASQLPLALNALPDTPTFVSIALPVTNLSEPAQLAQRHLRNGDINAALEVVGTLTAQNQPESDDWLVIAEVQLAAGQYEQTRDSLRTSLQNNPDEALRLRSTFLLANAEYHLTNWPEVANLTASMPVPDGLGDAVALLRAQAALGSGDTGAAKTELNRPELRSSTNREFLKTAAQLAGQIGENGLSGEFFAAAGRYSDWATDRSQTLFAAGQALEKAGKTTEAIQQYRTVLEEYTWTEQAPEAWWGLGRLRGDTSYHTGLIEAASGRNEAAQAAFQKAAQGGTYADAAKEQLRQLETRLAWQAASGDDTSAAYRSFHDRYPESSQAAEAWFREGFSHYRAEQLAEAAQIWNEGTGKLTGDSSARLHLWCSKALTALGQEIESNDHLKAAAQTQPAGYYTVRAQDLLKNVNGWPGSGSLPTTLSEKERQEIYAWIDSWSGTGQISDWTSTTTAQRVNGLLTLGRTTAAAAEADGWIDGDQDPRMLFAAAEGLAAQELWASARKATDKLLSIATSKNVSQVPQVLRKLSHPLAYADLVKAESQRQGLGQMLLLAMIRQESGFDPLAHSPAQARGLTQITPDTAQYLAGALGWNHFEQTDLDHPVMAMEFGAQYLADQLNSFGGNAFQALAAYNAGPQSVSQWATEDNDLFIERIDYPETQEYIRQVYLNHAVYRSLSTQ
jgi:soluble lytic murein transglycosylase-like protein/TolA-binding protein